MCDWLYRQVVVFLAMCGMMNAMSSNSTNVVIKKFSAQEIINNSHKSEICFEHEILTPCNHLIFSWNILYPSSGYFSLFVQIKQNGVWREWHHIADWSQHIHRSYTSKALYSSFHHVRLEIPSSDTTQALRINIVGNQGANLSNVRALAVNVVHMQYLENLVRSNNLYQLASVHLKHVDHYSQLHIHHPRAHHMCSPTSLSMLLNYLCPHKIDILRTALSVYDTGLDAFGSWPFNTAYAFNYCKGNYLFYVARLASFKDIHVLLAKGMPVIVSVRGALKGAPKDYNNGHLLLIVGWNQKKQHVLCHDPAFKDKHKVYIEYPIDDFCKAWSRSHNLAYITELF